jgi:hypothetical protein
MRLDALVGGWSKAAGVKRVGNLWSALTSFANLLAAEAAAAGKRKRLQPRRGCAWRLRRLVSLRRGVASPEVFLFSPEWN